MKYVVMAGDRIVWIQSWFRNASRPASLKMITISTRHLTGERLDVASSYCLFAGTERMYAEDNSMEVDMFSCLLITEAEFQGVSTRTDSIIITKIEVSVLSDDDSVRITAIIMSSGSYSGLMIQAPV